MVEGVLTKAIPALPYRADNMLFKFCSAIRVSYMQAAHDRDKNKHLRGFKLNTSL